MRSRLPTILLAINLLLMVSLSGAAAQGAPPGRPGPQATPLGTSFTYQGQLSNSAGPVSGSCDFQFSLWDAASAGSQVGATVAANAVTVSNGLFMVTLDFGASPFGGEARWLLIAVRCPAGSGAFAQLSPRQALTAAPYALTSRSTGAIQGRAIGTTAPLSGQVLKWNGQQWAPADDSVGTGPGGGDITSVTAGAGLTGGSVSGDATLSVVFAGNGSAGSAARSDHNHYGATWTGAANKGLTVITTNTATGAGAAAALYGRQGTPSNTSIFAPAGVWGDSAGSIGVFGSSLSNPGVYGFSSSFAGVIGSSPNGIGVQGQANGGTALTPPAGAGVWGDSSDGPGVVASSGSGNPIEAYGTNLNGSPTSAVFRVDQNGNVRADGAFVPGGADFAELLPAVGGLEPGDVLAIGADGRLARSAQAGSTAVVGVYSTRPGLLGGAQGSVAGKVPLAVSGIVPVKVSAESGAIRPGDLLVASATPGHAMRAPGDPAAGTVIGKALGGLEQGTGVVEMLVMLR